MLTRNLSSEALKAQPQRADPGEGKGHSFGTYLLSAYSTHLAQRDVTMGVVSLTINEAPRLKQENGFLLEEAHSGSHMQSGLKRGRVRMGSIGHHCYDLGLLRRWPEYRVRGERRKMVQRYEDIEDLGAWSQLRWPRFLALATWVGDGALTKLVGC